MSAKVTAPILTGVIIVSTEPPRYAELVELARAPQQLAEEDCPGADLGLPADPDDVAGLGQITGPGEITGFGEIADPGVVAGLGAIAGPDEIAGLGETERRRALVAQAARFTAAFARWTDGRSYGGLTYTRLRLLETTQYTLLLRAVLGEQADLLLHGQRARSTKLDGFTFRYPDLPSALAEVSA